MQALLVTEILLNVLDFADRTTLSRLAPTCRAFEDPALDVLWKELPTLEPLSGLFPDSIFERDHDSNKNCLKLREPPSVEDWERMRKYTSRVTGVLSSNWGRLGSFNKLLVIASIHPPESLCPMFPKLRTINATGGYVTIAPVIMSPWVDPSSISQVVLEHRALDRDKKKLKWIGRLGASYPNVKRVDIYIIPDGLLPVVRTLQRALSRSICAWKHLTHASFNLLNTATYEHIVKLDSITSLELDISRIWPQLLRQATIPPVPFPFVTDLTLTAGDTTELIEWISHNHRSLSTLFCRANKFVSQRPSEFASLCVLIAANYCHQTLRSLSLENEYIKLMLVRVDSIRPLFAFSRLHTVNLSFCTTCIADDGLRELAESWPLLEVLILTPYTPYRVYTVDSDELGDKDVKVDPVVFPTFRGLFHLVERCQHLRELSMLMDARDTDWVDLENPCNGIRSCIMEKLTVGNSPINDHERVSSILACIFPRLSQLTITVQKSNTSPCLNWQEAAHHKKMLQMWKKVSSHLSNLKHLSTPSDPRQIGGGSYEIIRINK